MRGAIVDLVLAVGSSVTSASAKEVLARTRRVGGIGTLSAQTSVSTGVGGAPGAASTLVLTTGSTTVAWVAGASVGSEQICAGTMVGACVLQERALIHISLTEVSNEAEDAVAGRGLGISVIRIVNTNSAVLAGRGCDNTSVNDFAERTGVAGGALALGGEVSATKIDVQAASTVLAGVDVARRRNLAGEASVSTNAAAGNRGATGGAGGTVEAGGITSSASCDKAIAKGTIEVGVASASEGRFREGDTGIDTAGSM